MIKKVRDMPKSFVFSSDSSSVETLRDMYKTEDFASFFMDMEQDEIKELWGMFGIIPHLNNEVYKVDL